MMSRLSVLVKSTRQNKNPTRYGNRRLPAGAPEPCCFAQRTRPASAIGDCQRVPGTLLLRVKSTLRFFVHSNILLRKIFCCTGIGKDSARRSLGFATTFILKQGLTLARHSPCQPLNADASFCSAKTASPQI